MVVFNSAASLKIYTADSKRSNQLPHITHVTENKPNLLCFLKMLNDHDATYSRCFLMTFSHFK